MQYTIKIEDSDPMAQSIILMLKELAKKHTFLEISEPDGNIKKNIAEELDSRFEYVQKNMKEGESWEEVKARILSK